MAYFAIICDEHPPIIKRCHINVWRFDGILAPRAFYFDVGIGIRGNESGTTSKNFRLALPFSVDPNVKPVDLKANVLVTASLIFGRVVTTVGDTMSFKERNGTSVALSAVSAEKIDAHSNKSGDGYSVWDVELPSAPKADREVYLRYRFHVADFSRCWRSHGDGEIVDIRVADPREASAIDDWGSLQDQILDIEILRLFVIVPSALEALTQSPVGKVRGHEGSVWRPYTQRRRGDRGKYSILNFKPDTGDGAVSASNPFRLYLTLTRVRSSHPWFAQVITILAACCGTLLAIHYAWIWAQAEALVTEYYGRVLSFGFVFAMFKNREALARLKHVGRWLRSADRWLQLLPR